MQTWMALLALVLMITSPAMAVEDNALDAPQPEPAPSVNDYLVPPPIEVEDIREGDTLTGVRELENSPPEMISVGPDGLPTDIN
jgi:hypothetical protein